MPEVGAPIPERPRALERITEAVEHRAPAERVDARAAEAVTSAPTAALAIPAAAVAPPPKSPLREDIESALADGLDHIYAGLPPDRQAVFRQEGERVAVKLETMLSSGTVVLKLVHRWIVAWLKLLPRRSKAFAFFLLQEAKVKTDAILALARRQSGQ